MATTPHILRLPPELILRISAYLTTEELGRFRGACRTVERSLFDSFAREFFSKRQFMLEEYSLQTLIDIADHDTLSRRLEEVIIGLDHYRIPGDYIMDGNGNEITARRQEAGNLPHHVFVECGRARDMLVEAFSKLPNLRKVGLRDYGAQGRFREGEKARWRSYGWSLGLDHIVRQNMSQQGNFQHHSTQLGPPNTAFTLLLYSLGLSSARPQSFEVFLRKTGISLMSLNVVHGFLRSPVTSILTGLTTLMLRLDEGESRGGYPHAGIAEQYGYLKKLLAHTTRLQHLRLNFVDEVYKPDHFLRWLGDPTTTVLPNLNALDLGLLVVDDSTLLAIINKYKLKKLSLWKCALDAASIVDTDQMWPRFLENWSKTLAVDMDFILLGFVRCSSQFETVRFATSVETDKNGERKYTGAESQVTFRKRFGDDARDWLRKLAALAHIPHDLHRDRDLFTSDEDEDGDLDMEDDDDLGEEVEEESWHTESVQSESQHSAGD